jgi:hypothetical protein
LESWCWFPKSAIAADLQSGSVHFPFSISHFSFAITDALTSFVKTAIAAYEELKEVFGK